MSDTSPREDACASVPPAARPPGDGVNRIEQGSAPEHADRVEREREAVAGGDWRAVAGKAAPGDAEYLAVHAANLEREVRRLRKELCRMATQVESLQQNVQTLERAGDNWRALYEAVIHSRSW